MKNIIVIIIFILFVIFVVYSSLQPVPKSNQADKLTPTSTPKVTSIPTTLPTPTFAPTATATPVPTLPHFRVNVREGDDD